MIIGAFIAGVIAAVRSTDPGAVGIRTGLLGGVVGVLTFVVRVVSNPATAWPLSRVVFWAFATGLVLCVAPVFGLAFGHVGGWVANTVISRRTADTNAS
jgi:hypothetical protein